VENPDVAIGVFTLIGTLIGALIAGGFSFLVTNRTLRYQEAVWQRQTRLHELERKRNEIAQLIVALGSMDLVSDSEGNVKVSMTSSPAARSAYYQYITWHTQLTKNYAQSLSMDRLVDMLSQLEFERREITEQIDQLIKESGR